MKPHCFLFALALVTPAACFADWRADADARIARLRQGDFVVRVRDGDGRPVPGARVNYHLRRHRFLFGMAIAYAPFADRGPDGKAYRDFIRENFSGLVCENEMKWYADEAERGHVTYGQADALMQFADDNGLAMRGHNIFWAKAKYAMPWLRGLDQPQLRAAVEHRLQSVVGRYRGRVVSWDVNNEMLDGSFYRDRLGADIVPRMFQEAARIDPRAQLFVNEYGIIGDAAKTERLIALVKSLQAAGAPVQGVGIQAHDTARFVGGGAERQAELRLGTPLTPAIFLASLDHIAAATGLPLEITEISARHPDPELRGRALETLFRLAFSHQDVAAIVLWGFGAKTHWMGPNAALMDADNRLNAAGERIHRLLTEEWTSRGTAVTDARGEAHFRGFFGRYEVDGAQADLGQAGASVEVTRRFTGR